MQIQEKLLYIAFTEVENGSDDTEDFYIICSGDCGGQNNGKKATGELQPSELVITILLSEIAAIPMQDTDIPLLNSVVAVLLLVAFEIISSVIP